jgi:hypothetical protein
VDHTVTKLHAQLVTHATTLDEVVIIDDTGHEVASGPVSEHAVAPGVWDRRLLTLGFTRVAPWTTHSRPRVHLVCAVEPKPCNQRAP